MTQTTSTPNVQADTFNMFRLSAITGLTPRTIRYYIAKGLCPKPYGQRRGAYYDRTHVVALMELKRRQEQGYRLSELKGSKADGEPLPERAVEDLPAHEAQPPRADAANTSRDESFYPLSKDGARFAKSVSTHPDGTLVRYRKTEHYEILPGLELSFAQHQCPMHIDPEVIASIADDIYNRLANPVQTAKQQ